MLRPYLLKFILIFISLGFFDIAAAISMSTLDIPKYFYSIQYPTGWEHRDFGKGLVVFKGKTENDSQGVLINIQTIATKKNGGHYSDVKALMDDFYDQVPKHSQKVTFGERRVFTIEDQQGEILQGEQTTVTFFEKGQMLKHWQIMLMTGDGKLFQNWAYRTVEKDFEGNRPLAEAMLGSWRIK